MILSITVIFIGAIILCRSLSFVVMQFNLRADRELWCLPRLVKQQKAADLAIVLYHLCISLVGAWLCVYSACGIFLEKCTPFYITVMMPTVLVVFFLVYLLVLYWIDNKNSMLKTYNEVVAYRKKQKVVTQDNDHEVNFIRGAKKVVKQRRFAIVWIGFLIGMMLFQIL